MKLFVLVIVVSLIFSACTENPTVTSETGTVTGKIKVEEQYSESFPDLNYFRVTVMGTNGNAYTDSQGNYTIADIPVGTYSIYAIDGNPIIYYSEASLPYYYSLFGEVDNIKVEAGKVIEVPDITLDYQNQGNEDCFLQSLRLVDSLKNTYYFGSETHITTSKQTRIIGQFYCYDEMYPDTSVSIKLNGIRTLANTKKQYFSHPIILADGFNDIDVWLGDTEDPQGKKSSSSIYYTQSINNVDIELNWNSYDINGVDVDAGDFDLILINEQTGDTCWYQNTNPDWGFEGVNFDNPRLNRDENFYGDTHGRESLFIDNAAEGTYTLKVNYFTNSTSSNIKIIPYVNIELQGNLVEYTPQNPMHVGDLWTVTEITFPAQILKSAGNKIERFETQIDKRNFKK